MRLLCWLGFHKWHVLSIITKRELEPGFRMCQRCARREKRVFYSNRTMDWVLFDK